MACDRVRRLSGGGRVLLFLLAVCCLGAAVPPASAAGLVMSVEERAFLVDHPVIRYSDSDWRPLAIYDEGRLTGLLHDYYALLASKTGLAFQFEPVGGGHDFGQVLDALRERRIDMIGGTGRTAERGTYALFVGPFFRFPLAIVTRSGLKVDSLDALAGRKVAVGRSGTAFEYLRQHAPDIVLEPVKDAVAALAMTALGKADATVENLAVAAYAIRASGLTNIGIAGQLKHESDIYTLVRSDWPPLASILTKAQALVTEQEKAALLAKWLPGRGSGDATTPVVDPARAAIAFTDRERDYLAAKKVLRYCVDPDWAPVDRIDENGRYVGIGSDFLKLFGDRLGVSMELVPTASWSQSLDAVKKHRCDFLPVAGETKDRRRFLRFTSPYLHFPMVVATRSDAPYIENAGSLKGRSLGVANSYASLDLLRAKYPDMRLLEVSSASEGLTLVADGKLYGYIDIVPAISQALSRGRFSDLKIAGRLDTHLDLALASRDDEPELASLFQKAVNTLSPEDSDHIMKKWLAVTYEQGIDYALVWKVVAAAVLVLLVVIWWNRKLSRLNRALRLANEARDAAAGRVAALLDNAGQGFLSVDREGTVDPQYSAECRNIFGGDIEGRNVAALLYPDDAAGREAMTVNVRRVVDEPDAYRRDLYLSLMPKQLGRGAASLRLGYRTLGGNRLMCIITDVTGEVRLKDAVARERNRLACVVAAVREQRDFFTVLDDFVAFRRDGAAEAAAVANARDALDLVYRKVHTFKGLFWQLECTNAGKALDALEERLSRLRRQETPDRAAMLALLAEPDVDAALSRDLDVVREALGEEYFARRGEVRVDGELADALADLAGRLLARLDALALDPADAAVLDATRALRFVDVRKLLSASPRTAMRLAKAQGKLLAPFAVEGDAVAVDPARFAPLAKSLIHGIRNAVDHGLESPEERDAAGKDEVGHIDLRVEAREGDVRIVLSDDGRGVDVGAVRARAYELGLVGAEELAGMDDAAILNLVFRDGFTSRRVAGELSGRGVGLAAVRAEVERLGGSVSLNNAPGQGMRLVIDVPLEP